MAALFDQIGADGLRAVMRDFYDRLFDDLMIGFFFKGKDKERLVEKEYELTARLLGAAVPYTGTPLAKAHAPHPIMGGHFMRRLKILEDTLAAHAVAQPVRDAWIRHTLELRPQITSDGGSECDHEGAARRLR